MFLHNKKSLLKKALSIATVVVLIVTTIVGVVKHINKQVDAATPEGQPVTVTKEYNIHYGDHWGTNRFSIDTGGQNITGYCANPSKKSLEGTFPAVILPSSSTNNAIVLMIYVSTVNNSVTQSVMNDLFSSISDEDQRYAYSHATIGALYANDYYKLDSSDVNMVNGIITKLQNMISSQSDAWLMAKNYRLYTIDRSGTEYADSNEYQDIMWVEDNNIYGNIKVQKKDSDTNSSTPQGGASLQGIRFEVYNNSGSRIYNPKTGAFYNNGALVASGTTNANGEVTFSNLVAGSYSVKETATNSSYDLTSTSAQTTTITTNGQTQTLSFYNTVKKGSIKVSKKDIELNVCEQLGKSQFAGVNFQIINDSASPVYYNGSSVAVGSMVAGKSLNTGDCEVTFSDLPYGKYIVREYSTGVGFVSNSQTYSVTIPSNNTVNLSVEFKNQVIRGDVKFKKINKNDNKPMANIPFRITSKTTGESHIVVSDANGIVNTSASVNAHSNHTNGYDAISNPSTITYQNYGTWFGKSSSSTRMAPVNDSLGALPYDEYEIIEISCDQNKFCYDIASEKQSFEIKNNNVVVDLGNWENDCPPFSLATTAVDATDGDKYIVVGSTAKIKDTISYCLKTNTNFTIKGTLMDKTTGQPLMKNGSVIEQTIDVNSSSECGVAEMNFEFDASALAGHDVVVFEKMYYNDELVTSHENLNDAAQTVSIVNLSTTAVDASDNDKFVVAKNNAGIKDIISYCAKAGTEFTFKGTLIDKATGLPLTNNGSVIEESVNVAPTEACGQVEMVFNINASMLFGREIVVYEKMYQGDTLVMSHENINDVAQTVSIISVATSASDGSSSDIADKYIEISEEAKIKDIISYCLKANTEFTIKGTLMDKTTGEPITKDGNVIEESVKVKPTTACNEVEMDFEFDSSSLASHEIVVFEKVYYGDNLIASHENLNDVSQTVYIISLSTLAQNGSEIIDDDEKGEEDEDSDGDESGENDTNSEEGEIVDEEGADAGNDGETNNGEDQEEGNEEETPSDKVEKKYIEVSKEAKIKDTISYCLRKDVKFTIKGTLMDKTTGEPLKLEDKIIEESIEITPEEACGVAEMNFEFDASALAGHDVVVFERLYYDDRLILSHEDIEDEGQTVYIIDLTTYATNSKDGSKDVAASGIVKIIDKVKYCLKAKTEFTVKGILMDKKTEKPLLIDGKPVEQTIVFIPENTCGETEMVYEFDATGLGGMEIVIFEDVYQGEELLIRHRDFANLNETFYLHVPTPDTGFATKTLEGGNENNIIFIAIATAAVFGVAGIYGGIRIKSRKKFLGHF